MTTPTGASASDAVALIEALIEGVDNLPGVTLDARDGMGVRLHTSAQVRDWLREEAVIAMTSASRSAKSCAWGDHSPHPCEVVHPNRPPLASSD